MKGIFIIIDGVADLPCRILGQKTPLEAANTPNLDDLAKKSKLDYCFTVREGVAPQSSNAVISLFGRDPNMAPRGSLEAMGSGIKLTNGDLAFRTNFATVDNLEDKNLLDSRAGRTLTTKEAKILAKEINKKVKLPIKFEFYPTVGHRGALIFRGGFSENITNVDPNYGRGVANSNSDKKVHISKPLDDEDDSKYSADLVNKFVRQSFEILDKHPINIRRAKKGLHAANIILPRDAGNHPVKFKKLKGKWASVCYMPLEIGVSKSLNMNIYKFKPLKIKSMDIYANLHASLKGFMKFTIKTLKKKHKRYDYFYIHFKKTDTPGHDNLPLEKVKMIEALDKQFFSFLKEFIKMSGPQGGRLGRRTGGQRTSSDRTPPKILITADHTTACKLKAHTSDPVPVLTYPNPTKKQIKDQRFTEASGLKGKKILGKKLLDSNFF